MKTRPMGTAVSAGDLRSTAETAALLDIPYWMLYDLLRSRAIPSPARIGRGLAWGAADIDRARAAIEQRRASAGRHAIES